MEKLVVDRARERSLPSSRAWAYWPFRLLTTLVLMLLSLQAVLAGQFLSGSYSSLLWHRNVAALADMVLLATLPAALLIRWRSQAPWWPTFGAAGLLALSYTQSELGFGRVLTVHVPLGVAMIMGAAALAGWAWLHPRTRAPQPEVAACSAADSCA